MILYFVQERGLGKTVLQIFKRTWWNRTRSFDRDQVKPYSIQWLLDSGTINPYWQGFGVWPSVFWGKKFRILISPKLWRHYRTWVGHAMLHGYLVGGCTTTQNDVSQWRHVTKICASKVDYPSNRGVWPSVFSGKKFRKTFYAILSILGFDPACFREKIPHVGFLFLKTRWVKPRNSGKNFQDLPIGAFLQHRKCIKC